MSPAVAARTELGTRPRPRDGADAAPAVAPRGQSRFVFALSTRQDDPDIRRLLRENALPGAISLSFEREPDAAVAASIEGDLHQTLVARDRGTGRIAGLAARSVRTLFVNGRATRVGYLGQLRVARGCRSLRTLIDEGFAFCRALHERGDAPAYLTSLVSDNDAARRLLVERRSATAPRFTPIDGLTTFAIPVGQTPRHADRVRTCPGRSDLVDEIAACLQRNLRRYQFAPCWEAEELTSRLPGLSPTDFVVAVDDHRVVGCAALWDQRAFKQVVVRGYSPALRRARPLVNLAGRLLGTPHLPAIGEQLQFGYLSHIAVDDDREDILGALVAAQMGRARRAGLDYVVAAFADRHAFQPAVRRTWRHRAYASVLYAACWFDGEGFVQSLDGRPAQPEVAIL